MKAMHGDLVCNGSNKQVLNIFDPNSNADLGNTKDSFKNFGK